MSKRSAQLSPRSYGIEDEGNESTDLTLPVAKRAKTGKEDRHPRTAADFLTHAAARASVVLIATGATCSIEETWATLAPLISDDCSGYARLLNYDEGISCLEVWPREKNLRPLCVASLVEQLTAIACPTVAWTLSATHTGTTSVRASGTWFAPPERIMVVMADAPFSDCTWWNSKRIGIGTRCCKPSVGGHAGHFFCEAHRCAKCGEGKARNGESKCSKCTTRPTPID